MPFALAIDPDSRSVVILLEAVVVGDEVINGLAEVGGVGGAEDRVAEVGLPNPFRQGRAVRVVVDQAQGDVEVLFLAGRDQLGEPRQAQ